MTREFDLCGPLPTGVTVLEASAGTGKTYAIAALAARYVAGGWPLEQLLLVTFTRMATGELRERVRERLVAAERALALGRPGDEIERLLADGSPEEVARRRDLLARALADFDAATINTLHGFCQEVLAGLGVAADAMGDEELVEDASDLREEVVDDLYVRRFHRERSGERSDGERAARDRKREARGRSGARFSREEAGEIARIAVNNPLAPVEPADAAEDTLPAMRRRLALAVREELERRKRRAGIITYDDLLTRLDDVLRGPGGEAVARRLRARYRVVLVDEFQDTDPIQWRIFRRAFGTGTLVLIGDPKQAIYAFRGADVYAYLEAAAEAQERATLEVNRRSDQALLDAYDALFGDARLGHPGIVYRPARAASGERRASLDGAPLRFRVVPRAELPGGMTPRGFARKAVAEEHIAHDLADDVVRLLSSPTASIDGRRVSPGDVAVLVQTNRSAAAVRDALEAVDVPAVINGAGSVFATGPARDWLRLLEALERPTSTIRARAAALTPFLGWSAGRVAEAGEPEWEAVHRRLHEWARILRLRGVASLVETITLVEGLPARVLARADGERALTDLRHVGQLLHAAATTEHLGTTALAGWLRRRIAEAGDDTSDEDRSRRLESDAQAVQVLTVHRSKGLEFPIVYLPFLWEPGYIPEREPVAFHDPDAGDRRTIDVGLDGPGFRAHRQQYETERRGEDLRLAYVALTRARHQAVVWWAGSFGSRNAPLTRLLFARADDGTVAPQGAATPTDEAAWRRLSELAERAPGCVSVEVARRGMPATWGGQLPAVTELAVAHLGRALDRRWRRTSFSDITAEAHEARVASEPEEGALADEPEGPVVLPGGDDGRGAAAHAGQLALDGVAPAADLAAADLAAADLHAVPSKLAAMPAGTEVGTFVHRVLEVTDFAAADLDAELRERVDAVLRRRATDVGDRATVVAGLRAAIETPLGPLLGGAALRDVERADRLDELSFELPLAGGDVPAGEVDLDAVAALLRAHLPPGDPLAAYADRLGDPLLRRRVRGYATGSLDLVVRVGGRYAVLDHKTNRLAAGELTAWHHRPAALAAEMRRAHYGLQALLYVVALHRYLRWRLPGYDPDEHLAGVLYLFLRGMTGPDTPVVDGTPCGVFAWRPPGALVAALSDALDRGAA